MKGIYFFGENHCFLMAESFLEATYTKWVKIMVKWGKHPLAHYKFCNSLKKGGKWPPAALHFFGAAGVILHCSCPGRIADTYCGKW